ncbi:hypothetical protein I7I52_07600 [Histoplasma capsulatum]|uniref:Uncharacterized protein n=1 Tax=Ajellomyces capsulatus TaxID=5037 RepID=A0A8H7YDU3_AJECA|nr:hypothetical protein I7I52_07600 [Histoplasma capsulatum]
MPRHEQPRTGSCMHTVSKPSIQWVPWSPTEKKKKYRARTGKGAKKGVRRTMTDVWMCCLQWSCFCLSMPLRDKLFIVEPMIISSLEADINLMAW